jgi:hypothetical protein
MLWDTALADWYRVRPEYPPGWLETRREIVGLEPGSTWCPCQLLTGAQLAESLGYVKVSRIVAVMGDYAIMEVKSRRTTTVPEPWLVEDPVFVARPQIRALPTGAVTVGEVYRALAWGRVAGHVGPLSQTGGRARLVLSLAEDTVPGPGNDDALLMRIYRETTDIPVPLGRRAAGLITWAGRDDIGWTHRLPTDNTTRARGLLDVIEIHSWDFVAGFVVATVHDGLMADDGDLVWTEDARLTVPVVQGPSGPWARMDTFLGNAGARAARARGTPTVYTEEGDYAPEFTLDPRADDDV